MGYTSVNNLNQLNFNSVSSNRFVALINGDASTPSFTWKSNLTSGFYMLSDNKTLGITIDGKETVNVNQYGVVVPQGSAGSPSYGFLNDAKSGFCSNGTGQINVICNNFVVTQFGANQQRGQPGSVTLPFYSFQLDATSGMFLIDTEKIGFSTASTERLRITNTTTEFSTRAMFTAGNSSNPSISFTSNTTTGLFSALANTIGITCNAFQVGQFDTAGLKINSGSAAFPTLSFLTDTDTGLYRGGVNILDVACGGVQSLQIAGSGTYFPLGNVTLPGISFLGDTNTGFYRGTADEIDVACNGIRSVNFSFYGVKTGNGGLGSASYSFLDEVTSGMYKSAPGNLDFACGGNRGLNLTAAGCRTPDGSNLAPSYSFLNDIDTGIYSISANSMGFVAGGTLCAYINNSDFIAQSRLFINNMGTVVFPSISFVGDTNTGFYQSALDNLDVSAGGVRIINFNSGSVLLGLDGSAAGPSLAFLSDPDTGIYKGSVNRLSISCGGSLCSEFTTAFIINSVPIHASTGGASTPGYSFGGDTNTGFYWNGADQIGISQGGAARWVFNGSYNFQPAATNTYDIGTSSVLLRDCYSTRVLVGAGSASAASYTFNGDTDTGIYQYNPNAIGFTAGNGWRMIIDPIGIYASVNTYLANGSAASPGLSFVNDSNTGLYSYGGDQIGVACGGTLVGRFFNAGFIMNGNIFTDLPPSGGTIHWYLRTNGGVLRNAIGMGATESGGDTGSNLTFWNYTDGGGFKNNIYQNERSTNNNYFWGRLWVGQTGSTTIPSLGFLNQTDCGLSSFYTDQIEFITNSVHRFSITNNSILPAADAAYNLGSAGLRCNTIFASVGTINTSDRTLKDDITPCALGLDFINQLKPVKYKWKNRTYEEKYQCPETKEEKIRTIEKVHSRYHLGLIAQDVKETLDDLKIDTNDFAGYVDSSVNEANVHTLGLNYVQFIAPMIKAIQELSTAIQALTQRIEALEELPA